MRNAARHASERAPAAALAPAASPSSAFALPPGISKVPGVPIAPTRPPSGPLALTRFSSPLPTIPSSVGSLRQRRSSLVVFLVCGLSRVLSTSAHLRIHEGSGEAGWCAAGFVGVIATLGVVPCEQWCCDGCARCAFGLSRFRASRPRPALVPSGSAICSAGSCVFARGFGTDDQRGIRAAPLRKKLADNSFSTQ